MPKLTSGTGITGTVQNMLFYKRGDTYLLRSVSSLTRKRVLTDKAFLKTMEQASIMATASHLASKLYKSLPKNKRNHALFHALVSAALEGVKAGLSSKKIEVRIKKDFPEFKYLRKIRRQSLKTTQLRPGASRVSMAVA
jgi:hypothetical protein